MSTDPTPTVTVELTFTGTNSLRAAHDVNQALTNNGYAGTVTALNVIEDDGTPPPEPDPVVIARAWQDSVRRVVSEYVDDWEALGPGTRGEIISTVADLLARGIIAPGWRA